LKTPLDPKSDLFVSVVAPLHNAGGYIERFIAETAAVLSARCKDYEIVLIDNCSRDDTVERVERVQQTTKNVQLYCLVSGIEDESVFLAGLEQAVGDVVITMDARLDHPKCIPEFLRHFEEGAEIVYGERAAMRRDDLHSQLSQLILRTAFGLMRRRFDLSVDTSTFRLMSRKVINAFLDNSDRYALFNVIAAFTGFRHKSVRYEPVNLTGAPIRRSLFEELVRSLRIAFLASKSPMRLLVLAALAGAGINLVYSVYVVIVAIFVDGVAEGWTSLSVQMSVMFFILFAILAVLSDYVLRLVVHNQRRPHYLIARERSSLVLSRKQELNVALEARRDHAAELTAKTKPYDESADYQQR